MIVLEAGPSAVEKKSQEFFESAEWQGYPLEGLHVGRFRALGGTTNLWPGQLVPFDPIVFEERSWVLRRLLAYQTLPPSTRITRRPLSSSVCNAARMTKRSGGSLKTQVPDLGEDLDVFLTRWTPAAELCRAL